MKSVRKTTTGVTIRSYRKKLPKQGQATLVYKAATLRIYEQVGSRSRNQRYPTTNAGCWIVHTNHGSVIVIVEPGKTTFEFSRDGKVYRDVFDRNYNKQWIVHYANDLSSKAVEEPGCKNDTV